jgi:hypothetical protein
MKTLGPIYVDTVNYGNRGFLPVIEPGWTSEIESPFRKGKCLVFRFPFTRPGLAIGIFGKTRLEESEALLSAIQGRVIPLSNWSQEGVSVQEDY